MCVIMFLPSFSNLLQLFLGSSRWPGASLRICDSAEYDHFPQALPLDNPMLSDFQLSTYGVLCLERCWDNEGQLTKLWVLNQEESDCDWTMTSLESTFGALYHFF